MFLVKGCSCEGASGKKQLFEFQDAYRKPSERVAPIFVCYRLLENPERKTRKSDKWTRFNLRPINILVFFSTLVDSSFFLTFCFDLSHFFYYISFLCSVQRSSIRSSTDISEMRKWTHDISRSLRSWINRTT